jgi:hypothetical protein
MKKIFIFLLLLDIILLVACDQLNPNPPAYVKNVVTYKEGSDGVIIYFTLADGSGAMTTSDGTATVTISETHSEWNDWRSEFVETEEKLFLKSFTVNKTDFQMAKVGMGAFEHKQLLYSFGRITYSSFYKEPSEMTGKIVLEFRTPSGQILKGDEIIIF